MIKERAFKAGVAVLAIIMALSIAAFLGFTDSYGTTSASVDLFLVTVSIVAAVGTVDLARTFYEGPGGDNRLAHLLGWGIPLLLLLGWWGGMGDVIRTSSPYYKERGLTVLGCYFYAAWFRLYHHTAGLGGEESERPKQVGRR